MHTVPDCLVLRGVIIFRLTGCVTPPTCCRAQKETRASAAQPHIVFKTRPGNGYSLRGKGELACEPFEPHQQVRLSLAEPRSTVVHSSDPFFCFLALLVEAFTWDGAVVFFCSCGNETINYLSYPNGTAHGILSSSQYFIPQPTGKEPINEDMSFRVRNQGPSERSETCRFSTST